MINSEILYLEITVIFFLNLVGVTFKLKFFRYILVYILTKENHIFD